MIDIFLQSISQPMLIVHASTGVNYINQCEGNNCNQKVAEGFLVPMEDPQGYLNPDEQSMTAIIELTESFDLGSNLFNGLIEALPKVTVFINDDWQRLALDIDRAGEVVEAWVPVRVESVKGLATLIWNNSD